jgi:large subunit ribosomal protein L22e
MKVAHLRNNLNGRVKIVKNETEKTVEIEASVPYSKRACRYYARKFLKKHGLRDRFRVIATSKNSYEFRPYRVSSNE